MVQTGTEGDRGNQHDHSQRRAYDRRSHRHGVDLAPGLEGKSEAYRGWSWQIQHRVASQQGRAPDCKPLTASHPLGRIANGEPGGGKSKADENDPEPTAENGPVERDTGRRVEGPDRAERTYRRQSNRRANGEKRPDGNGPNNADEGVGSKGRGVCT
jgi:hypothetical protein